MRKLAEEIVDLLKRFSEKQLKLVSFLQHIDLE